MVIGLEPMGIRKEAMRRLRPGKMKVKFCCVLTGTLAKGEVYGGLREGIGFCVSHCSLLSCFVGWWQV